MTSLATHLKTTLAVTSLVFSLAACGDSGGSGFGDATNGGDTGGTNTDTGGTNTDTGGVNTDTGGTNTDTGGTNTDTGGTNTDTGGTNTDTGGPGVDVTQVQRQCTDNEITTLNTCIGNCAQGDQACQQACANGATPACLGAIQALAQCGQGAGCAASDAQCALDNCPVEAAAVFGPPTPPTDCNPVTNAGCMTGENCTFVDQTLQTVGCQAAGTAMIDQDCSATGCERGACLGAAGGGAAMCAQFCNSGADCPAGRPCNIALQGSTFTFCGDVPTSCDLFAQDCPTAGEGCYLIDQQGGTDCSANNGVATGGSCAFLNDCAPGNICAGAQGSGVCRALCKTDGSVACTSGTCTAIGVADIGACQ